MAYTNDDFARLLFCMAEVAKSDALAEAGAFDEESVMRGVQAQTFLDEYLDCYKITDTDEFWRAMHAAAAGLLGSVVPV